MKIRTPSKKIVGHYENQIPDDSTWEVKLDKPTPDGNYTTSFSEQGIYSITLSSKGMESTEIFFNL